METIIQQMLHGLDWSIVRGVNSNKIEKWILFSISNRNHGSFHQGCFQRHDLFTFSIKWTKKRLRHGTQECKLIGCVCTRIGGTCICWWYCPHFDSAKNWGEVLLSLLSIIYLRIYILIANWSRILFFIEK